MWMLNKYPEHNDDRKPHHSEACLQFAFSTDNDLEVFIIKVKFNYMSLPTEMLKIICTFFTLIWIIKIKTLRM